MHKFKLLNMDFNFVILFLEIKKYQLNTLSNSQKLNLYMKIFKCSWNPCIKKNFNNKHNCKI